MGHPALINIAANSQLRKSILLNDSSPLIQHCNLEQ